MEVVKDEERCKRTGTKWRCPKKVVPGRTYCEKHHLYTLSRYKRNRTNTITDTNTDTNTNTNTNTNTDTDNVEDDGLPVGVSEVKCDSSSSEVYRPVIDFTEVENYQFALPDLGNDDFTLGELLGGGFGELGWCGNDDFTVCKAGGEEGNAGFGQLGWGGNDGFALGDDVKCDENEKNGEYGKVGQGQKRRKVDLLGPKLEEGHDI